MPIQLLKIKKSVFGMNILSTSFWHCIDILLDGICFYTHLVYFLLSTCLIDVLKNEEVFVSVFPAVRYWTIMNDVTQTLLNTIVDLIMQFVLLVADLNIMTKPLTEATLAAVAGDVSFD